MGAWGPRLTVVIVLGACGGKASDDGNGASGSGSTDSVDDGQDAATYANCDDQGSCSDGEICVPYQNGDDMPPGIQWCAAPCTVGGDASECPPPHPNSMATPTCVELADGSGVCALDCEGGYLCPPGMSCFDGLRCVWGDT